MIGRVGLVLVTLFWVIMNVLLWRNSHGSSTSGGSPVSVDTVMEKLLTSPDSSTLEVQHHGKVAGFLHWYPDPGEEAEAVLSEDYIPSGMVRTGRDLDVRLEGSLSPPDYDIRVRVEVGLKFSPDRTWETANILLATREMQVSFRASTADQEIKWQLDSKGLSISNRVSFEDARDPRKLLGHFAGPLEPLLATPWFAAIPEDLDPAEVVTLDARLDRLPLGSSNLQIYRLRTRWLGRHEATALINRAGEILRVDLPGGWRLVNEGLSGF